MAKDSQKTTAESYAVIAVIAALALLGVVVLTVAVIIPLQQAEARGCENGLSNFTINAFFSSKGRCFGH
jgi:hypothetical protein